jgi:hypothetical protein
LESGRWFGLGSSAGALALVTTIAIFSIAWGVVLAMLSFKLKGIKSTAQPAPRPA